MAYQDPRVMTEFSELLIGQFFYPAPRKDPYAAMIKLMKHSDAEYAYAEGNAKGSRFPVKTLGRTTVWIEFPGYTKVSAGPYSNR